MDVRLSPEQIALRDAAAQVVGRLGPGTVAALDDAERAAKLDAAVVESGWRELRCADEQGAAWASAVEVALVAEELAKGCADTAFVGPVLAAELRRTARAPEALGRETVALRPDLGGIAAAGDDAVAVDAFGDSAALVLVPSPDGTTLGAVDVPAHHDPPSSRVKRSSDVPTRGRERTARSRGADGGGVDLTRPTTPVGTTGAQPVGGHPLAAADLARWTALALAVTAADLLGTMRGATELAVAYAAERRQFGRSIGSFQAVQHLLADSVVHVEGTRSAVLHAAWAVDALPPAEALAAAAAAKAYASRAARTVCETAVQVHGGIGNTWECLAHVHLRRALLSTDVLGGVGPNLARVLAHAGIGGG